MDSQPTPIVPSLATPPGTVEDLHATEAEIAEITERLERYSTMWWRQAYASDLAADSDFSKADAYALADRHIAIAIAHGLVVAGPVPGSFIIAASVPLAMDQGEGGGSPRFAYDHDHVPLSTEAEAVRAPVEGGEGDPRDLIRYVVPDAPEDALLIQMREPGGEWLTARRITTEDHGLDPLLVVDFCMAVDAIREALRGGTASVPIGEEEGERPRFLVEEVMPLGTTLLAGPPKIGKSYFALSLAVAAATGGTSGLAGQAVHASDVLYIHLQGTRQGLRERLESMCPDGDALSRITAWTRDEVMSGLSDLESYLASHPCDLVIVDSLADELRRANLSSYEDEYDATRDLARTCSRHGASALLVLDSARIQSGDDPLNHLMGMTAVTAACDGAMMVLDTNGRGRQLHVVHRDHEPSTWDVKQLGSGAFAITGRIGGSSTEAEA
ncbi:MAG: AAA family ATPase [Bacteroidota bacterium]